MRAGSRAWLLVLAGCYDPRISAGTACSPLGECPDGLPCVNGVCVLPGTGEPDAMATPDARGDAPAPDVDAAPDGPSNLGPIAHWTFDTDPATGVVDSSGRGHTGACLTTCPGLVTGRIGGAYLFTAAQEMALVVPDHPDFRGPYTIAAWVNAGTSTADLSIMAKPVGIGSANSWQLELLASDVMSLSGGSPHYLEAATPFPRGTWHHVAGSWDGTTKRLYIDGLPVVEVAATVSYDGRALVLGADRNAGNPVLFWDGALDDVRIYDRALSGAELAALAQ